MRNALLQERWADALVEWIDQTDIAVDVYDDEVLWTDERLDVGHASMEIRMAPLFVD